MSSFGRDENGEISIVISTQESQVLINLTEQLLELLSQGESLAEHQDPLLHLVGISDSDALPEDPVLRRLFPDAYEDSASAGEFRRYTEYGLREKKKAHARIIYEALTSQEEPEEISSSHTPIDKGSFKLIIESSQILDWLSGLNDLRLALAVRLGIGGDKSERESIDTEAIHKKYELMLESDPMKAVYAVYSWIGWLQQSLLEEISPS
ncbi:MAG: DUF2017 domain-containing protein [Actinobacteria bacterium]|nr:DUF2017 domain-containing protein [Actinomycetota bacterium]